MCVICHKARGVKLPSAETLRDMWESNPDGAGVMWREGRKVRYLKGFMDEKEFMGWIEKSRDALDATECALHFRITTHGGTNQQNCHPFPLDRRTNPHALTGCCRAVLMHNGVMPLKPRDPKYSDTAEYTMRAKESGDAARYVRSTSEWVARDNRLCVFLPKETLLVGNWQKRKGDECDYSNLNFEHYCDLGYGFGCGYGFGRDFKPAKKGETAPSAKPDPCDWEHDYYWDWTRECWSNGLGQRVSLGEVDPDSLSAVDSDLYWDQIDSMMDDEAGITDEMEVCHGR